MRLDRSRSDSTDDFNNIKTSSPVNIKWWAKDLVCEYIDHLNIYMRRKPQITCQVEEVRSGYLELKLNKRSKTKKPKRT